MTDEEFAQAEAEWEAECERAIEARALRELYGDDEYRSDVIGNL